MRTELRSLVVVLLLFAAIQVQAAGPAKNQSDPDRVVGTVLGKSVTAADIGLSAPIDTALTFDSRDRQQWEQMGRITLAFGKPLRDRFVREHGIEASAEDIAQFKQTSREQRQNHLAETEDRLEQVKVELASPKLTEQEKTKLVEERDLLERVLPTLRSSAGDEFPDELARQFIVARKTERELQRTYGGRVIFQQAGPEALDARRSLYEEAEKRGDLKFDDTGVRHLFYYYYNMTHVVTDEKTLELFLASPGPRVRNKGFQAARPQPKTRGVTAKATPPAEKTWIISEVAGQPPKLAPRQIVPVESGVWFGGRPPGSGSAPIGFLDLKTRQVSLLLENGGQNWNAVGAEAIAVQLDRKSLVRLSAEERRVATWEKPPQGCRYFSQVATYGPRFCISSPYEPLQVYDTWLKSWQKIPLKLVTDADSERLGPGYYRPSMNRFVIGPGGELWGFQGTHDALRGNAVCHYVPERGTWEQFGFPWAMARGDDHWPIGETNSVVLFAGRKDLLLFDKVSHRWTTSKLKLPAAAYDAAQFTPHGVLIPAGNEVRRLTDDLSAWDVVATLDSGAPITALGARGESLYLATTAGIYRFEKMGAAQFAEQDFYPWKFSNETKTYRAVFGLASEDRALALADELCSAATKGDAERVRVLLSEGADTETTTDPAGATPLLLACANGHLRVAELLVEKGADLHARNLSRQNALILAAQGGHRQLADYLMSRGVTR